MKVPAIIACSLICLVLGVGVGAVGATYLGLTTDKLWSKGAQANAENGENKAGDGPDFKPPMGGPKAMGFGMMPGMMPGKGPGMDFGMGKGPSAKAQLNTLIAKLDALTQKPLTINLNDEQKQQIREQIAGLADLEELTDADAQKRLDGLLQALEDHKAPLEVTGFRWPGDKGPGALPKDQNNPFKEEANAKRLQSLEQRLGKEAS